MFFYYMNYSVDEDRANCIIDSTTIYFFPSFLYDFCNI